MLRTCSATMATERDPSKAAAEYIMPSIQVVQATPAMSEQSSKGGFIAESQEYDEVAGSHVMELDANDGVKVGFAAPICDH